MVVQQHVLNWLYSVLTTSFVKEYQDVNRTYNDVAQALSQYPSLSPRTDVHTFDNGVSALLLHLSGTIPVIFRGTTYRFPISLWIPHAYPREAPLGYVTPTENMMVRPGQHVDPQGRIYHPYLVGWAEFWDKSSLLDFLAILRDIFAKEPPVVSRQQARLPQQASPTPTPPPVPPLPPDISRRTSQQAPTPGPVDQRPPLPPPKGSDLPQAVSGPSISTRPDGPPLPPLPNELRRQSSQYGAQAVAQSQSQPQPLQQSNRLSRYDAALPLPPQQGHPLPTQSYQQPPPNNIPYQPQQPQHPYQQSGPLPSDFPPQDSRRTSMISPATPYSTTIPAAAPAPGPSSFTGPPPPIWQPAPQQPAAQPKPKPPPPPDLMDEPFSLALPSPTSTLPPPIPPNPEKDALQRHLASALYDLRQRARTQNKSSLAGLAAQRAAMLSALQRLQSDSATLVPLTNLLTSNTSILQHSLREADHVIERARARAAASPPDTPDIDELLVAPTVVANQLYDVVAEERALGDAVFVLGRAVERGRVSPAVFARTTRALAREWFLKKALVRKIGRGMGLVG
ncbi:suppressor protein stp22 of temperature-sensitive alpha-factor receptor and arginine permease [Parahypoxylon ruwenzoriense]